MCAGGLRGSPKIPEAPRGSVEDAASPAGILVVPLFLPLSRVPGDAFPGARASRPRRVQGQPCIRYPRVRGQDARAPRSAPPASPVRGAASPVRINGAEAARLGSGVEPARTGPASAASTDGRAQGWHTGGHVHLHPSIRPIGREQDRPEPGQGRSGRGSAPAQAPPGSGSALRWGRRWPPSRGSFAGSGSSPCARRLPARTSASASPTAPRRS